MEKFVVSARKYRPRTFSTVVGQKALTDTLKKSIATGHLAHAYLFCGPRGVGKTTCARIFAKAINCLNPTPDHEACEQCESCKAFNEQRSFNIHELDAASNNSVEDIRKLIEQVRIPPQIGKYSVYIIDEVHMLSPQAFNAFLKTLEEPPAYAIFILATTEKHKVLATILSRCQIYDFSRITVKDAIEHLAHVAEQEGIQADAEALQVIAQKADGGMRDALSIFDQMVNYCGDHITYQQVIDNLNVLDTEYYFRLVDCFLNADVSHSLLILNEIIDKGFDPQSFMTGLAQHLRDLLVSRDEQTTRLLDTTQNIAQHYAQQARQCSERFIFEGLHIANECDLNYRISRNRRLLIELTLIRLCQLNAKVDSTETSKAPSIQKFTPPPTAPKAPVQQEEKPAAPAPSQPVKETTEHQNPQPAATSVQQAVTPPATQITPSATTRTASLPRQRISITQATNTVSDKPSAHAQDSQKAEYGHEPFSEEDVIAAWRGYASTLENDARARSIILAYTPRLIDAHTFQIALDNKMQQDVVHQMSPKLMDFIRQRIKNSDIDMQFSLNEQSELQAYTSEKRYQIMTEENALLRDLKDRLKLQLE
ncbi:MAG: DNA polymerase III subunit gamma/tau [Paludibacteraceae bacterium]|nr:DNA polymerase III subunit gamma/tau [Paludibacteraceae bacterium]